MDISFIIVTYNSLDLIENCINSIFELADIPETNYEIIVVDNSDEIEHNKLSKFLGVKYGTSIELIKNENLGYGHGNNVGIAHSSGKLICIMNPDVRFVEPLMNDTFNEFLNNPKLGLIGYKQNGGSNLSFYLKPEYYLSFFSNIIVKFFNKFNLFNSKFFYLSGAFMFLSREIFEKVGLFDERFFMYFEEPDIANRILEINSDIKYKSNKVYLHLVGERSSFSEVLFMKWIESLKYYLSKYNINKSIYYNLKVLDYKANRIIKRRNKNAVVKIEKELNKFKINF